MQNFTRKKQAVSHSLNTREEKKCLNLDCYISMGCCRQLLFWRIHFHYKSDVQYFYALNHICLQIKKYWLTPNLEVSSQSCRKKPLIGWIEEILSPASWLWCSGSPQALGNLSVLGGRTCKLCTINICSGACIGMILMLFPPLWSDVLAEIMTRATVLVEI